MQALVHHAKTLAAGFLMYSGLLALVQQLRRPHVLVLAYHRVTPDDQLPAVDYPAMHVGTTTFALQLRVLRRLYDVVPLAELEAYLSGATPLRRHVAAITFDDGYRDNYRNAFPILARENLPATFFLSVGFVDRGEAFWFDRLAAAARGWDARPEARDAVHLPAGLVAALNAAAPRVERLRRAAAFLKSLPDGERRAVVDALEGLESTPAGEPMTWDEVRTLRGAGMGIGAHGTQHAILTRMPAADAAGDIRTSIDTIAARLDAPVTAFAYPNGDADATVAAAAAAAGMRLGFTMQPANPRPGVDRLRCGRRNVCEDTSRSAWRRFSRSYFACEITGGFDFILRRGSRSEVKHA
jgi:peptidoglycan/xylan/chitin deacetylase (PgdA/CDA1 family)